MVAKKTTQSSNDIVEIDPRKSPFFGPVDAGDGSATMGNGDGSGVLDWSKTGVGGPFDNVPMGESKQIEGSYGDHAANWLKEKNYALLSKPKGAEGEYRYLYDKTNKKILGEPQFFSNQDAPFGLAMSALMSLAGAGVAPGIGQALGFTGTTATAVGSGIANSTLAAVQGAKGGNILKAGVAGAVGPALSAIPGFSNLPAIAKAGIGGAASGAISGGSLQSALLGAITAGAGSAAGAGATNLGANPQMAAIVKSFLQQAIRAKLTGQPPGKG